jgi:hypothetical protein
LGCAVLLAGALGANPASGQGGLLDAIRSDVRGLPSVTDDSDADSSPAESGRGNSRRHHHGGGHDSCDDGWISYWMVELSGYAVTSPWWGPHVALQDDLRLQGYFPRFPYDGRGGYITTDPGEPRRWAARLQAEYADQFGDTSRVGGQLLLSSASRWGLDTAMDRFEERLSGGRDRLWLGDCNVVYRFAQSERAEFRTGIGFNWLDDPAQTDFGFNFTYGADFFPGKPWVLSSTLDWGSLGDAELFRFRATVGALVRRTEVYTGYEYLDVDSVEMNALVAGIRLWF